MGRSLGYTEVDYLWNRLVVLDGDENVRGFDVSVDDALLMRVLHPFTDLDEKLQPLLDGQTVLVAILGDGLTANQLHREVGSALVRRSRVVHTGYIRMIHQSQSLPLGLEPGDDRLGVHAPLDELEGHLSMDGLFLLSLVHDSHAAVANFLKDAVGADLLSACRFALVVPLKRYRSCVQAECFQLLHR